MYRSITCTIMVTVVSSADLAHVKDYSWEEELV